MTNRIALITGGGSGIGYVTAKRLAKAGVIVVLAGRNEAKLIAASAEIEGSSHIQMDVADASSVQAAFTRLGRQSLVPDILVNNAGSAQTAPFEKTSLEKWNAMLAVNLTGAFLCTKEALPAMKAKGFGRIITIASTAGLRGYAYTAAYTAAKHGVIGMTKSLALELAGSGVTANTVCPGFTDTDIVRESVNNIVAKTGRCGKEAMAELTKHNPEGRLITPEEVANTVAWLASDGASAINGQSIAVACGEVM